MGPGSLLVQPEGACVVLVFCLCRVVERPCYITTVAAAAAAVLAPVSASERARASEREKGEGQASARTRGPSSIARVPPDTTPTPPPNDTISFLGLENAIQRDRAGVEANNDKRRQPPPLLTASLTLSSHTHTRNPITY